MNFPCFWLVLGFIFGIVVQPWLQVPRIVLAALFLLGLPFLWISRGRKFFLILFSFHLAILGIFYADFDSQKPSQAIEQWVGTDRLSLEGMVKTQPEIKVHGKRRVVSFVLSSKNLMRREESEQKSFHETKGDVQVFLFNPELVPNYGDRVRLWGILEKPRAVLNPGEFDYGKYLAQQEITALFKGFGEKSIRIIRVTEGIMFRRVIEKWRLAMDQRIDHLFKRSIQSNFDLGSELFKALILGKRKGIPDELRDDFMKTGTSHLLAISGLNITLIAGTFSFFLLLLRWEQKIAAACGLGMVIVYVFIAGIFFLALFLLLIFDPGVLFNLSFQLSFISVFSLIWIFRVWPGRVLWKEWFGQTLAVMVGTFPIAIYYFNIFSFSSIFANLGAIPLFHLAMVSAIMALLIGDIPFLGFLAVKCGLFFLHLGVAWIHLLAKAAWGYSFLRSPSLLHLVFYYIFLGIFFGLKAVSRPWISWLRAGVMGLWLITAGAFFLYPEDPAFSLTILAAGKNEIAHIRFSGRHHWLINAGRAFPSNQGQWLVDPYLRKMGIKDLEAVMMTDLSAKHWGGLPAVLRNFSVRSFIYPQTALFPKTSAGPIRLGRTHRLPALRGKKINIEGAGQIEILEVVDGRVLFRVSAGQKHFLFLPGLNENILSALKKYRDALFAADALIFPAIGKWHENRLPEFLGELFEMTDPEMALISGESQELKDFLQDRDIPLWETSRLGALTLRIEKGFLRVDAFRRLPDPADVLQ
ncbi:MAG: ComEC/Rec2 family competence protein [Candidatus Omnitrophica bacterium]|nr:ComEC/Rec2 family competence protein [Candidatus Omnitrophota bacterium]